MFKSPLPAQQVELPGARNWPGRPRQPLRVPGSWSPPSCNPPPTVSQDFIPRTQTLRLLLCPHSIPLFHGLPTKSNPHHGLPLPPTKGLGAPRRLSSGSAPSRSTRSIGWHVVCTMGAGVQRDWGSMSRGQRLTAFLNACHCFEMDTLVHAKPNSQPGGSGRHRAPTTPSSPPSSDTTTTGHTADTGLGSARRGRERGWRPGRRRAKGSVC